MRMSQGVPQKAATCKKSVGGCGGGSLVTSVVVVQRMASALAQSRRTGRNGIDPGTTGEATTACQSLEASSDLLNQLVR